MLVAMILVVSLQPLAPLKIRNFAVGLTCMEIILTGRETMQAHHLQALDHHLIIHTKLLPVRLSENEKLVLLFVIIYQCFLELLLLIIVS